jgi:hypothetical protein
MGIEPTAQAWEAWVLPLYDARYGIDSSHCPGRQAINSSPALARGVGALGCPRSKRLPERRAAGAEPQRKEAQIRRA